MALADILTPQLIELGKIKIGGLGAPRKGARGDWRPPVKHDYFTVTTMRRVGGEKTGDLIPDQVLMDSLAETYADKEDWKLRTLPVQVLSNDPESVMETRWVHYRGKKLVAWADGKTLYWRFDSDGNAYPPGEEFAEAWEEKWETWAPAPGQPGFKMFTEFRCIIASPMGRLGGVYKFRTTSKISAERLYSSLLHIGVITSGQLMNIPLMLQVTPVIVSPEGKTTTVYVVHLEVRGGDLAAIQKLARDSARLRLTNAVEVKKIEAQYKRLCLPPGTSSDDADVSEMVQEFSLSGEQVKSEEIDKPSEGVDPLLAEAIKRSEQSKRVDIGPGVSPGDDPAIDQKMAEGLREAAGDPEGFRGEDFPSDSQAAAEDEGNPSTCLPCHGLGTIETELYGVTECPTCKGSGKTVKFGVVREPALSGKAWDDVRRAGELCTTCRGNGFTTAPDGSYLDCQRCAATGRTPRVAPEPAKATPAAAPPPPPLALQPRATGFGAVAAKVAPAAAVASTASAAAPASTQAAAIVTPVPVAPPAPASPAAAPAPADDKPAIEPKSIEDAADSSESFEAAFHAFSQAHGKTAEESRILLKAVTFNNALHQYKIRVKVLDAYANGALSPEGRLPA